MKKYKKIKKNKKKKIIQKQQRKKKSFKKKNIKRKIIKIKTKKHFKKNYKKSNKKEESFLLKTIRFQESIKNKFTFKLNFNFLVIDQFIAKFFQKIENKIIQFKEIKAEEKRRIKLEAIEKAEEEKRIKEKENKNILNI